MNEITENVDDFFKEREKEKAKDNRLREQKNNHDYAENREKCEDCGSYLNSHDHCPRCDY